MLKAEKQRPVQWLAERYIAWRVRRMFHAVTLSGDTDALESPANYPLVLYANHQSWWDGFLLLLLYRHYRMDYFLMMEAKNLQKFSLFRKMGVFGVDLDSASGRRASLLYATRLLRDAPAGARRVLTIFPHGRLIDPAQEWPPFAPGLQTLVRACPGHRAVPVCLHLRFGKYPWPEAFLRVGHLVEGGEAVATGNLEEALRETRAGLHADLHEPDRAISGVSLIPARRHFHGQT